MVYASTVDTREEMRYPVQHFVSAVNNTDENFKRLNFCSLRSALCFRQPL
jgi:hypothetical protein